MFRKFQKNQPKGLQIIIVGCGKVGTTLIEQLSKEIGNTEKKTTDLSQFISNVKKYTEITELTPEILNELIEKILVHQAEKVNDKKVQEIDIYYRGVGIISFPVSLEDMTMVIEKMINKKISA